MGKITLTPFIILVSAFIGTPAIANAADAAGYFEPKSPQERPVHRPAGCGNDGLRNDSYISDFEGGNLTVIPTYNDANLLSLNLIFRYWHKDQGKTSPEKVELRVFPSAKTFIVKKLYRSTLTTVPDALFGESYLEEAYLEFSVGPNDVKHIAVVLPEGTITRDRRAQKIPPVLFDYVGQSTGVSRSKISRCLYSTEPPSKLDIAKLQAPPLVKPLKAESLTGTWIVDGKASGESIKNSHPPSVDEYLSAAGWVFLLVYEFGNGFLTQGSYLGDDKRTYRLLPEQSSGTKLVYKTETPHGTDDDFLAVSAADGGNISISSFPDEFSFKRIKLDPGKKDQDEKHVSEAIQEFMKIISPASSNAGK